MKPSFSLDQAPFYYPGQEIRVKSSSSYIISSEDFKALERGRVRLICIAAVFVFLFTVIILKLFEYTVLGEKTAAKVASNPVAVTEVKLARADIADKNGVLLATSLPTVNLYTDNNLLDDAETVARDLVRTIPSLDYDTVKKRLDKKGRFIYLKRNLTPKEQYEVNRLGHPALKFEDGEKRVYPQGNLFSHIVGAVDIDNAGLSGVEKSFNKELTESKTPLKLSLDLGVQYKVREILAESIQKYGAIGGSVAVMRVNTGEVVAMVSLPDFDPNDPPAGDSEAMFNRNTLGVYEFGSVFKTFNTALALESGKFGLAQKIDSSPFKFGRKVFRDDHPQDRPLNLAEVLAYSSNPASARIAVEIGKEKQQEFLEKLGLFTPSAIELPEKGRPQLPPRWGDLASINVSFGYGISVTPVQVLSAISALVNGGVFYPATIYARETAPEGVRVMTEENSVLMRQMLRYVVEVGTGKWADATGYEVGGKTGTAEKVVVGGFDKKRVRATFVSAFPMSEPAYAMLIMLDEPKSEAGVRGRTAGANTVPATKKLVEAIAPLLEITPKVQ